MFLHLSFLIFLFNFFIINSNSTVTRIKRAELSKADFDPFLGGDPNANCSIGNFYCDPEINGGRCIPMSWVCDSEIDCIDRTDEPSICPLKPCPENQFRCSLSGKCIPSGYRCDGEFDCGSTIDGKVDESDEEECTQQIQCPPGMSRCGETSHCIPLRLFCNGIRECPTNGADEHSNCEQAINSTAKHCKYGAKWTQNDGIQCYCAEGMVPNGEECIDENECERHLYGVPPVCAQICKNLIIKSTTDKKYECSCKDGYTFVDNMHCKAVNVPEKKDASVFLIAMGRIIHKSLKDVVFGKPFDEMDGIDAQAFAFDHRRRKICFVTKQFFNTSSYTAIQCLKILNDGKFDRSSIEWKKPIYPIEGISAMEYDWVGDNWWFLDTLYSRIFVCKGDAMSPCVVIRKRGLDKPESMSIDPVNGYIFISELGAKSYGIWRLNIDGSDLIPITNGTVVQPKAVFADSTTKTVFWVDNYLEHVQSIDYEKKGRRRHISSGNILKSIKSLQSFESKIYGASHLEKIVVMEKFPAKEQPPQIREDRGDFFKLDKIFIFHRQMQPDVEHPCKINNGGCEHFCLAKFVDEKPVKVCKCAEGYSSLENGQKCSSTFNETLPLLMFGRTRPGEIAAIPLSNNLESSQPQQPSGMIPIYNLRRQTSITLDSKEKKIYYCDTKNFTIHQRDIFGAGEQILTNQGINNCEGMALDIPSKNLYISDQGLRQIVVINVERPEFRHVLISSNLSNPRGIAVHAEKGWIFWSDWSDTARAENSAAKIEKAKLDGSSRSILVDSHIHWPNGLTIDYSMASGGWLYWCDAYFLTIERVRFTGGERKTILQGDAINNPYGIAIYKSFIFWSEFRTFKIKMIEVDSQGEIKVAPKLIFEDDVPLYELHIYDPSGDEKKIAAASNACSSEHKMGQCEQLCFPLDCSGTKCGQRICKCGFGYKISSDDPTKCEINEAEKNEKRCGIMQFECKRSKKCIDRDLICDSTDDCGDMSDEDRSAGGVCENFKCPDASAFLCASNQCIDSHWLCDGERDCTGGDDETLPQCAENPQCGPTKFLCKISKRCIPKKWECDGTLDCITHEGPGHSDTSDEESCEFREECPVGQFKCYNGKCISSNFVCDSHADCRDASDEAHCSKGCVEGAEFRCADTSPCMSAKFVCDGVIDCDNGSDENSTLCNSKQISSSKTEIQCPLENQFQCKHEFQCIRKIFKCDGDLDCNDGTDEFDCPMIKCPGDQFKCQDSTRCIPMKFKCDGWSDCSDNSDELACGRRIQPNSERCLPPHFLCQNDTKSTCLSPAHVCDGNFNCPNKDDEGFLCDEKLCNEAACEQECYNRPTGYVCACHEGYTLAEDGLKCHHSDPCSFGACSQLCEKQGSTKYCHCLPGYEIRADKFSCKSTSDEDPYMVYTNRYDIRMLKLGENKNEGNRSGISGKGISQTSIPLLSQLRNTIAIDYYFEDSDNILLFWSDIHKDQIFKGRIHSGILIDVKPLVKIGIWTAEGLAVDWIGKNVYWVDSLLDQIQVVNFDGTFTATVLKDDMHNLRALAIDPAKGLMFWTDWQEANPRIERATMAGTDRRILFRVLDVPNGGWPNGLTCDFAAERLYWIDAKSDSVHSMTYEGFDVRLILRDAINMAHPFAISVFEDHIYWSDWRNTKIFKANKWNGTNVTVIEDTANQPFDLKIVHSSRQPKAIKNPCLNSNKQCSHLCLIISSSMRQCACPHMMTLPQGVKDATTCIPINQTLIFATSTTVTAIDMDYPNKVVFPLLAPKGDENISALATDPSTTTIYWSDLIAGRIYKLSMGNASTTEQDVLLKFGAENCFGLAVDPFEGLLYFTGWRGDEKKKNESMGWISVITLDGRFKKTIISSKMDSKIKKPTQINYMNGELYWFDIGYSPPALFKSAANGKKVSEISLKSLAPNATIDAKSLVIDDNKRLFWTQPSLNFTRVLEIQKMKLHTIDFANDPMRSPTFVALDDGGHELIFYDKISGDILARMISSNYVAGGHAFELRKSFRQLRANNTNLVDMKIMDKLAFETELLSSSEEGATTITCATLKCDQICIRSFKELKCVCADGFSQDRSGKCGAPTQKLMFISMNYELFWQAIGSETSESESTEAHSIALSGNEVAQLQPRWMALDPIRNFAYFIDAKLNELFALNISKPDSLRKMHSGGGARLAGVAVDPVTGYIFVSSFVPMVPGRQLSANIELLHPNSDDLKISICRELNETIGQLAIDAKNGWLFWLSRTGIKKSRFDGTEKSQIIKNNPFISFLAVDEEKERLIYVTKSILSVNYDGTDQKVVKSNTSFYDSMTVLNGVLYYSERKQLYRADIGRDGSIINETLKNITSLKALIKDLKVFDLKKAQALDNPCKKNNGDCEHICYFLGPKNPRKCGCIFSKLNHDGKSCGRYRSFLAYIRGTQIEFAPTYGSLDSDEAHESISAAIERKELLGAFKPIKDADILRAPVAIVADIDRYQLIFSDIKANRLVAIKIDQTQHFVIVQDVKQVEGIAFDEIHRDLYFTSGTSILRVSMLDEYSNAYPKKPTVVLELNEYDKPRGIAVDPCHMQIYYTNWRADMPTINRLYFSGFKHETIISTDIRTPNSIAIDFSAQKLYWADARLDKIERCDYDGKNREIVIENFNRSSAIDYPAHPFSLVIHGDYIYYTDWVHRAVLMLSKFDGEGTVVIHGNLPDQPMGLTVYADDVVKCGADECSKEIGKSLHCQDLCRMDSKGKAHCSCHPGRILNSDNATCFGDGPRLECSQNQFLCLSSGRCIDYEETCDGVAECPEGEDESEDYCAARICRTGYFTCGNGMCISESKRCNKANDCINFHDEHNCKCSPSEYQCKNGQCIEQEKRCDFNKDCSDTTDEINCPKRDCASLQYQNKSMINCAHTTQCILAEWFCDGASDCWDDWDELNCPSSILKTPFKPKMNLRNCTPEEYSCRGTGTCIPKNFVCDGTKDCATGSDEEECPSRAKAEKCLDGSFSPECSEKCDLSRSFLCKTGVCIPKSFRCDEIDDCFDGKVKGELSSDETNCTNSISTPLMLCRPSEFQCETKRTRSSMPDCIPLRNYCDGEPDCYDKSDEPHGCVHRQCGADEFKCTSGQCIPQNWACNSIPDCLDQSDESSLICGVHYRNSCPPHQFECNNGICIPESLMCNLKDDCSDNTDEFGCNRNECERDHPCEDQCIQKKIGFQCHCTEEGKILNPADNRTCIFQNRCSELPCSQICEVHGRASRYRYRCGCEDGYFIEPDRERICRHKYTAEEPELLVITRRHLRVYSLTGAPRQILASNLTNGVAVDFDIESKKVFFSDVSMVGSTLAFIRRDVNDTENTYNELSHLTTTSPEGIFIDYIGRNIYWSDRDSHSISVSDILGRYSRVLLKGKPLSEPRSIAGDPEMGLLFWSDWGAKAHIGRMTLTGKEVRLIIDTSLRWPNALAVDGPSKRLYWGDAYLDYIGSSDYNGDNRKVVLRKSVGRIFGLTIFEDFLYWSESTNRTIQRANKRSGEEQKTILEAQLYKPMGIKIWHSVLQKKAPSIVKGNSHPCDFPSRCDNLCIPTITDKKYECLCAKGFKFEGNRCIPDCNPTEFVCEKTYKCLAFYWKCDGQNDCGDFQDEPADCPKFHCSPGHMMCNPGVQVHNSSNCIESELICDGQKDCPEGEDEDPKLCSDYNCHEDQFKCPNSTKCIALTSLCDGNKDCPNGADERDCALHFSKCVEPNFFACRDPKTSQTIKCIQRSYLFDGEVDCPNGDDESIPKFEPPQCPSGNFECGFGASRRCVQTIHLCDGQTDCIDGSDEGILLCANRTCSQYEFSCGTGRCIPVSWVCDGARDCKKGEDEEDCGPITGKCNDQQFMCATDKRCILAKFKCDGEYDCSDHSDEHDCEETSDVTKCAEHEYPCTDGITCFTEQQKCDGVANCRDFSDEINCYPCDNTTFQCKIPSSKCIPMSYVCDGKEQCIDGSDEVFCDCDEEDSYYQEGGMRCQQNSSASTSLIHRYQCIPKIKICDGISQCSKGEDEDPRVCERNGCPPSHLRCSNNHCYPYSGYCDGVSDCPSASDERNDYCQTKCLDAFRCDNARCIDKKLQCNAEDNCGDASDERDCGKHLCETFATCSQYCLQDGEMPKCYCDPGYIFESNSKCKAEDRNSAVAVLFNGRLMQTFKNKPNSMLLDVTTSELNQKIPNFDYVSYDGKTIVIYYLDGSGFVRNGSLEDVMKLGNERPKRDVLSHGELKAEDIAVDWIHKNVYTVTYHAPTKEGKISIAKLSNPENSVILIHSNLGKVTSLAISVHERRLYWSVQEPFAAIESSNLDGTFRSTLFATDIYEPQSLVVDEFNRRIYWVDTQKGSIESARMDGTDRRMIRKYGYKNGKMLDRPSSLDIFDDYFYILGQPGGSVWRTHKFGLDKNDTVVRKVRAENPVAYLKMIHPTKRFARHSTICTAADVCGAQPCITINEAPKCICAEDEQFDGMKCSPLRAILQAKMTQCGDYKCRNGGVCDKPSSSCRCPPGTHGKECQHTVCHNYCLNNGTCFVSYNYALQKPKAICRCPIAYMGSRCERFKCTGLCGAHGVCMIDELSGLTYCKCDIGWHGKNCDHYLSEKGNACENFCVNDGQCFIAAHSKPFCKCPEGYMGISCENCLTSEGDELVCMNGGQCNDRKICICPKGFVGKNCATDMCQNYCLNGGECLRNGTIYRNFVQCSCNKGFTGDRCEKDSCASNPNYCQNGGVCIHQPNGEPSCACLSMWTGKQCEEERKCQDWCLNESECQVVDAVAPDPINPNPVKQWLCNCKPGYIGQKCDILERCEGICENGATCRLDERLGPVCQCPRGIGGDRCDEVNATNCNEIECLNGGQCLEPFVGAAQCACRFGWYGLTCALPTCDGYCANGGTCFMQDNQPICRCSDNSLGSRCEISLSGPSKWEPPRSIGSMMTMLMLILFLCILATSGLYLIFIKHDRYGFKLFRHHRMFNDVEHDGDMDEFHNPAFMIGDDDGGFTPNETTNFSNPVFDEDSVYNDTVMTPLDPPDVIPTMIGISTIPSSNSEKKKLINDPLSDIQT